MKTTGSRSHTFTWQDPFSAAAAGLGLSGLDYLRKMAKGELPMAPISVLMNVTGAEVEEGLVTFTAQPLECHYNPIGLVHGGFAATLLDSVMACAIHSRLPQGQAYTTLDLHTHYVRAITLETGPVRAEGKVLHLGARMATAEGRVVDTKGRLFAHGTTTCMVFPGGQSHG
ncbi:MAG TPA: PaaI family thioesterase [Nevskia sp.]|nr:PaaI family thioesterase [Nevskia sp.]